ncbi:hypothetical protein F4818DRAFT_436450 [Hypoxylon cercidicola]|nr:hypothetical protein F4818DRAFT_436450 [Hypoxylon cercidicola]
MNPISLVTRNPKGGKGFKSGGGYGGGGGGGANLPLWVELVIIFSVLWACAYIALFVYFLRRARRDSRFLRKDENGYRRANTFGATGYAAWRAFKYMTLLGLVIWAVRKVGEYGRTFRDGRKKVGGTFYRKVEKEERGVKDGSESVETILSPHGPPPPPASYSPLG